MTNLVRFGVREAVLYVSVSGIVWLEFEARAKETLNALYHVDGAQFWRIFSLRVMLSDL